MEVTAKLNYLRISPRKVRLVADLIRNMDVTEAETQLSFITKRATDPILKLLNSAVANAKNNFGVEKSNLYISKVEINEGPPFKRWTPRALGRATPITKRTSHIKLILETKKEVPLKKKEKEKPKVVRSEKPEETPVKKEVDKKEESKPPKQKTPPKSRLKGFGKKLFRRKSI